MHPLLAKLNFKGQSRLVVLGKPPELAATFEAIAEEVTIGARLGKAEAFVLAFVRSCAEIDAIAARLAVALADDALLWLAYPKKSSKRYESDIGRDDGWSPLGRLGLEGVRQIAIDEDWSALRFRPVAHIKTMKRDPSRALSEAGKSRTRAKASR